MRRDVRRVLTALALSLGVSLGSAAIATATPDGPPQSGDSRATAVAGNVTTCRAAGIPGETIEVTSNITGNTDIDITAIPSGYQVTGVVVKGGPAYNKYPNLGELPWNDLHAPLVSSGKPAEISHWFVCGKPRTTTTKTTTNTTTKTTATSAGTSTGAGSSSSTPAGTSSSAPVVVGASDDTSGTSGLARTGFSGGPYVLIGGLLLIGGIAALVLARMRRRA
ncbi:hypothetical protein KIPE111705_44685 [Kibdelosporangium persicum]|uniref:Salivary glue protein Sgs-3 n=1 Tax=Kibdelosporangium persicum TaxID=2698649 RepID=A0ABX2F070_9PSEU|nr:hypothetical protein [Kibdelosporangium persicum]NRN64647.1 Salivary glue protein Sgs-3 [Kibdelosporangium persicum]